MKYTRALLALGIIFVLAATTGVILSESVHADGDDPPLDCDPDTPGCTGLAGLDADLSIVQPIVFGA